MYSLLCLDNCPIIEQLRIEEALLRADEGNWCLLNHGTPPAIVMGISGNPSALIDIASVKKDQVPVIKRFSGGGTVFVDEETIFVTFIANGQATPKPIFDFSKEIYSAFFPECFDLRENDYVFGNKKFGGNAQYIQKERWLHHTSFLWSYNPSKMNYLLLPQKRPAYRENRSHGDFLCSLSGLYASKADFLEQLKSHLLGALNATEVVLPEGLLDRPHRKGTLLIDLQ